MRDTGKAIILGLVFWVLMIGAALIGLERQDQWNREQAVKAMGVGRE